MVSETRRIRIPAGESEVRFEGVAGGIIPQTAIVTGLPEGIVERNRDAWLLSPGTLVDRSLGRRVAIRRTSRDSGRVRETEAVIRSGADGAVLLQTRDGVEALRCTGLVETLEFRSIPPGLSPQPTLSVRARARRTVMADITLSYLATGFDWQADYVATLSEDGRHIDLFAWLTLASNDETSFFDADMQAVAGAVNREPADVQPREGGPLTLSCWPQQTTSDIPLEETPQPQTVPAYHGRPRRRVGGNEDIVVTGARQPQPNLTSVSPVTVVNAVQEGLGDLKLYRIPEPVTIAANSQKQIGLLTRQQVEVSLVYRQTFRPLRGEEARPAQRVLVTENRESRGLGLPLPAGPLNLFASRHDRPLLLGRGPIHSDLTIGDDVEVYLGEAPGVRTRLVQVEHRGDDWEFELIVTNDHAEPIDFEAELDDYQNGFRTEVPLPERQGWALWAVAVPANGSASLRFHTSYRRPVR